MNNINKKFRDCISDDNNDLIIYAADNFSQFPNRDSSISSKSDRALAAARPNDLVVLRGKLDVNYNNWLHSLNLGTKFIVEYSAEAQGDSLSKMIMNNPDPILDIIKKTGRKPIYVPWFSSNEENELSAIIGADLFGAKHDDTIINNNKAIFKIICQKLNIPTIEGVSFKMNVDDSNNFSEMKDIVDKILKTHKLAILRGALGESGISLYKTTGDDINEIYKDLATAKEQTVIIEPFLDVFCSPNDQWIISRDESVHHLGVRDQICKDGLVHTGTQSELNITNDQRKYIEETSFKIVSEMASSGYVGVSGIDYVISSVGIFPVENNARFNGSSYVSLIVDNIDNVSDNKVGIWKFIKLNVDKCSFLELKEKLKSVIYDGIKQKSIFPFNCEAIEQTGNISFIFLGQTNKDIVDLENQLHELNI